MATGKCLLSLMHLSESLFSLHSLVWRTARRLKPKEQHTVSLFQLRPEWLWCLEDHRTSTPTATPTVHVLLFLLSIKLFFLVYVITFFVYVVYQNLAGISLVPSFWKDADKKHKFRGFSRQKFLLIVTWSLWSHWLSRNIIQLAWMWTSVEVCWELPLTCCSLSSLAPKRQTWRHLTKLQPTCKCWPCLRCSYRGEPTIPPIIVCSRYASNSLVPRPSHGHLPVLKKNKTNEWWKGLGTRLLCESNL